MLLFRLHIISITLLLLSACGQTARYEVRPVTGHNHPDHESTSDTPLDIALQQVGKPYRYGGSNPTGFDCSGLVYYSYQQSGTTIPRTSRQQLSVSRRIPVSRLRPGDLVFFSIPVTRVLHVGIYIGGNRFAHAPSSGKRVGIAYLDNPYWRKHFIRAGRISH